MASIVQRGSSYSVVYYIKENGIRNKKAYTSCCIALLNKLSCGNMWIATPFIKQRSLKPNQHHRQSNPCLNGKMSRKNQPSVNYRG